MSDIALLISSEPKPWLTLPIGDTNFPVGGIKTGTVGGTVTNNVGVDGFLYNIDWQMVGSKVVCNFKSVGPVNLSSNQFSFDVDYPISASNTNDKSGYGLITGDKLVTGIFTSINTGASNISASCEIATGSVDIAIKGVFIYNLV